MKRSVIVTGGFDNLRSREVRFLEEAAKLGPVTVRLWTDELVRRFLGASPQFPFAERRYLLEAIRYVAKVVPEDDLAHANALGAGATASPGMLWAILPGQAGDPQRAYALQHQLEFRIISEPELREFPDSPELTLPVDPSRKKAIVTGCFDWMHSGHVRFFEEVSTYGDLFVVVGHDANIRTLKGQGHPLLGQNERRYMVGAIRFVRQALIASGSGWVDADPEICQIRPDIYAVNEDGDKGGKREYCAERGIHYLVLKRAPAPGLDPRSSTALRGF